ncbi:MAG TPA: transcriptional repressor [Stellaceae bacterium]|jgi:Fur family ferric uptake transcriptional regulator|nr:transcriptional repressor [Stellaceae bacterium]
MARTPIVSTALLSLMRERHHHAWTLEDLHAGLAERDIAADFSSVFRAAEKLAAAGDIRKLTLEDGRARFELRDAHHDHLHCTRCGELVPVPCLLGPGNFAALEREAGIAILDHHLVLSGICRDCRASPVAGALA